PQPGQRAEATPGLHPLGLAGGRDGLRYVPVGYRPDRAVPLVLMLHGADGDARGGLAPLLALADQAGLLLVAPESRGRTWDVLLGGHGQDVAFIDEALAQTFSRFAVDATRLAVEGFSDGASYALVLGLVNGDLFSHVIAFSPCFAPRGATHGRSRLFISHGTGDGVLPIDDCSRRIVPRLRRAGYELRYEEFGGPHLVPPEIAREAVQWLTADRPPPR
ncbi:MAG: alpha/beta hydrolase-fold protein, partial [Actinomycetota bacterium]|nr:alpha/beta hydrolase-fold protein [Actinomycetota bacterium]